MRNTKPLPAGSGSVSSSYRRVLWTERNCDNGNDLAGATKNGLQSSA